MFVHASEQNIAESGAHQDRIELILDLTRRIHLLDELMAVARAKRQVRAELASVLNPSAFL